MKRISKNRGAHGDLIILPGGLSERLDCLFDFFGFD